MGISETLRTIAEGLKLCGVGKDGMLAILCLLKTPEQEEAMLEYMLNMELPEKETQLLEKAVEVSRGGETT